MLYKKGIPDLEQAISKPAILLLIITSIALVIVFPAKAFAVEQAATSTTLNKPVAKIADGTYRIASADSKNVALECPKGKATRGLQMTTAKASSSTNQKFFIRNEGNGLISIQSAASGLFLAQSGNKVVQSSDAATANRRWRAVSDSGIAFVNASTGDVLAIEGGVAKVGAAAIAGDDQLSSADRWNLTSMKLVTNGYYQVKSGYGGYLGATKASYAAGAGLRVSKVSAKNAEVFSIREAKKGWYHIESTRSFLSASASSQSVVQQASKARTNQLWSVSLDRSGGLVFKSKKTKSVMGITKKPTKSGVAVQLAKNAGKKGQSWELVKTKRYSLSGDKSLDRSVASILAKHGTLRKAYNHVAFDYRYISGNEIRSGKYLSKSKSVSYAKQFIRNGGGNCYRFSSLMSWLARGLGYSSNVVTGWVPGNLEPHAPHGWCEVYKGGRTYVCDPDMYNAVRDRNWYLQTYASAPVAYGFW